MRVIREIRAAFAMGAALDVEAKRVVRTFKYRGEEVSVTLRPLNFMEVQRLLIRARRRGWFGNSRLLGFVVQYALTVEERTRLRCEADAYLTARIAREVWLLTLTKIARVTRRLARSLELKTLVPSPRPFLPSQLASPGLMYLLAQESELRDQERWLDSWLSTLVVGVELGGMRLNPVEAADRIAADREVLAKHLLKEAGGEEAPAESIPERVFPSFAARAMAYEQLVFTLDWVQFARLVRLFNSVATVLVYRCNQLGGLLVGAQEARLVTGTPAFFGFVEAEGPPALVTAAIVMDLLTGDASRIPSRDRRRVRAAFDRTMKFMKANFSGETRPAVITSAFIGDFARQLPKDDALTQRLCIAYWEEFSESMNRMVADGLVRNARELAEFSRAVSAQSLVEGEADQIVVNGCLVVRKPRARVRVVECGSKEKLVARYRQILQQDAFAGAVITMLDADAGDEHEDVRRIDAGKATTAHFIHERGSLEDQIPVEQHLRALDRWTEGAAIRAEHLPAGKPMDIALKTALWEVRRISFQKVKHAEAVAAEIVESGVIPEKLAPIIASIVELAEIAERRTPRPTTPVGTDAEVRRYAFEEALMARMGSRPEIAAFVERYTRR